MKIALLTGTAYRHKYYANEIIANYDVVLHIKEKREQDLTGEVKDPCSEEDKILLKKHSDLRNQMEEKYFLPQGKDFLPVKKTMEVGRRELNSPEVIAAVKEAAPDVVLDYGTCLLKDDLLKVMPKHVINLHAGLSPYYKGAATLYWPIYFMEPQNLGYTMHIIDIQIDHGTILHQNKPEIFSNDNIHDLGCRTIVQAAKDIHKVLEKIQNGTIQYFKQKSKGKIFYGYDFKPYHLRVTNFIMENGLLKEYLEHKERFPEAEIFRQF
ncbi:MAG: formyltransferase family protein [Candidatus Pacebacteria bacterium]|nr:formyltransferase family protein [Candidatus Paceibacterota bacterium]